MFVYVFPLEDFGWFYWLDNRFVLEGDNRVSHVHLEVTYSWHYKGDIWVYSGEAFLHMADVKSNWGTFHENSESQANPRSPGFTSPGRSEGVRISDNFFSGFQWQERPREFDRESPITPTLVKERKEKPNEIGSHRELMVQLGLVPKSPLLCLAKLSQEKFFLGGKWLQTT